MRLFCFILFILVPVPHRLVGLEHCPEHRLFRKSVPNTVSEPPPGTTRTIPRTTRITSRTIRTMRTRSPPKGGQLVGVVLMVLEVILVVLGLVLVILGVVLKRVF